MKNNNAKPADYFTLHEVYMEHNHKMHGSQLAYHETRSLLELGFSGASVYALLI